MSEVLSVRSLELVDPQRYRMFVDDVSGVALWSIDGAEELDVLPMTEDLRTRIQSWVDEYTDSITNGGSSLPAGWSVDHDNRGKELAEELQRQVGPAAEIVYRPHTSELRRDMTHRAPS